MNKFRFYQMDCGPTCLRMVAKKYARNYTSRGRCKILVFIIFSILFLNAYAQSDTAVVTHNIKNLRNINPSEKVHLHLDRQFYDPGDTIWFKAYAVTGDEHKLSSLSGVLYAELISPNDTLVKRLILQLKAGITAGDFTLPPDLPSGTYRIRAYTNLMRNDSDYLFNRKVIIGGIEQKASAAAAATATATATTSSPDVQLFPEGGYLVNGLRSWVAFKAVNPSGLSGNVSGRVSDQDGNIVAEFRSVHAGMGRFVLTPQEGKTYKAHIIYAGGSLNADLPAALLQGYILTVNSIGDSVFVKVAVNKPYFEQHLNVPFYVMAISNGKCYYAAAKELNSQVFVASLAKKRFPSGITRFTLFDQHNVPVNERVIFIQNDDGMKLNLSTSKTSYAPLEKVQLDINADSLATATLSIAVTNESLSPVDKTTESTIFTDLLLASEIKGYIEDPGYYFSNTDSAKTDLDLLMLTQGYRRFDWKKVIAGDTIKPKYLPQTSLSLSGIIQTPSHKPVPNGNIQLTYVKGLFAADTTSDANGSFTFPDLYFSDTAKLVLNAKKINGGKNVVIGIRQPNYPAFSKGTDLVTDTSALPLSVINSLNKSYAATKQDFVKRGILLKQVSIKSKRNPFYEPVITDNLKFSSNRFGPGNADQVVLASNLTVHGNLSDALIGRMHFISIHDGKAYLPPYSKPMNIIVEGGMLSPDALESINTDDVYSIEVLERPMPLYGSDGAYGLLIITLKHGLGDDLIKGFPIDGLITYKFNGFYKQREFYSPKYTPANQPHPAIADDRKTIYWNPYLLTDKDGKTAVDYFNGGIPGNYRVVIEGIDINGNLGRQGINYKVE